LILAQHIIHVPFGEAVPAHIGADQRRIDVHNLRRGNLRPQASCDCTLEDLTKTLLAPALADARQAGMMRQLVMQPVTDEPADGDVNLRVAHQLAIVHDAGE
jgi:hypothetical protein